MDRREFTDFVAKAYLLLLLALGLGLGRLGAFGGVLQVISIVLLQVGWFQIEKARAPRLSPRPRLALPAGLGPLRPADIPLRKDEWKVAAPMLVNEEFYNLVFNSGLMVLLVNSAAWLGLKALGLFVAIAPWRSVAYANADGLWAVFLFAMICVRIAYESVETYLEKRRAGRKRGAGPLGRAGPGSGAGGATS